MIVVHRKCNNPLLAESSLGAACVTQHRLPQGCGMYMCAGLINRRSLDIPHICGKCEHLMNIWVELWLSRGSSLRTLEDDRETQGKIFASLSLICSHLKGRLKAYWYSYLIVVPVTHQLN